MIEKADITHLIHKHSLLQCEVDDRHIELINEIYALGMVAGKVRAKSSISWRINGDLWSNFIDEEMIP